MLFRSAAPSLTGEWILPLPLYTQSGAQQVASVGDLVAINGRQFLVLVRDGNGRGGDTPTSIYRAVLVYDVSGATNLAGSAFDNPNTPAAPKGVLASSIVPASSAVLINLNDSAQLARFGLNNGPSDNSNTLSDKWESLALVPALDPDLPDDFFLLVGNDNDYATTDGRQDGSNYKEDQNIDSMVLVYRVTLPGSGRATAPVVVTPPVGVYANPGSTASFSIVAAAGGGAVSYQWLKGGTAIAGATNPVFTLTGVQPADMDFYSVSLASRVGSAESLAAVLAVNTGGASRLVNVSTRGLVRAGDALTPGFVTKGVGTKSLLIRAVGPTLTAFGVPGVLADPRMDVIPLGGSLANWSNDDWIVGGSAQAAFASAGAFALPEGGSKDAALLAAVPAAGASGYTVRITSSAASAAGVALAEVYDLDPLSSPVRLVNVSTLGFAGTGADGLTPGFVIGGTAPKQLLIRAAGPVLAQSFGVGGVLSDPQLTVRPLGRATVVGFNNDWGDGGQEATLRLAFLAAGAFDLPAGSRDAALLVRLPPGGYTVQATGADGGTGVALVEIYDLDP